MHDQNMNFDDKTFLRPILKVNIEQTTVFNKF